MSLPTKNYVTLNHIFCWKNKKGPIHNFACQCTIKNVVMTKIDTSDFKKVTLTCKRYSCHEKGDNDIKKGMEAKK